MRPLYYASALVLAFVLGGATVRPFKEAMPLGYGGGLPAASTRADDTPSHAGTIMCGVDGDLEISNLFLGPAGLHGATLTVGGQCDTNHGPHPREPR